MIRFRQLFLIAVLSSLLILFSGCNKADDRPLFQRFGNGIDTASAEGLTDIWNMTRTIGNSNITVVESFNNDDSIWVGLRVEGKELISHRFFSAFYHNGEMIGAGSHGGSLEVDTENWIEETVRQPSSWADISALPNEFILELVIGDIQYQERTISFEIPIKRIDRKVIRP